ncbi:MAG: hypothetical protein HW403_112 [Dehalococcoidia bacterium]|nr:hypothetical protein [Dehalococcoidia bacterium]
MAQLRPTFGDPYHPPSQSGVDISYLIDRLESIIGSAQQLPLLGKVLLDRGALLALVDQMRLSLPEELKAAQDVLRERDGIIAKAQEEARRATREAEERANLLVQESEVYKAAETRARDTIALTERKAEGILSSANWEAQEQRRQIDLYSMDMLRRLEAHLSTHLSTLQGGIKALQETSAARDEGDQGQQ